MEHHPEGVFERCSERILRRRFLNILNIWRGSWDFGFFEENLCKRSLVKCLRILGSILGNWGEIFLSEPFENHEDFRDFEGFWRNVWMILGGFLGGICWGIVRGICWGDLQGGFVGGILYNIYIFIYDYNLLLLFYTVLHPRSPTLTKHRRGSKMPTLTSLG